MKREEIERRIAWLEARAKSPRYAHLIGIGDTLEWLAAEALRFLLPLAYAEGDETWMYLASLADKEIERLKRLLGDPEGTVAHADAITKYADEAKAAFATVTAERDRMREALEKWRCSTCGGLGKRFLGYDEVNDEKPIYNACCSSCGGTGLSPNSRAALGKE